MKVQIKVPLGEAIDRFLILILKANRFDDPNKLLDTLKEVTEVNDFLASLSSEHYETVKELREVHKELWDLEDQIRQIYLPDRLKIATKIATLNDRRAQLVATINGNTLSKEYSDKKAE